MVLSFAFADVKNTIFILLQRNYADVITTSALLLRYFHLQLFHFPHKQRFYKKEGKRSCLIKSFVKISTTSLRRAAP